MSRVFIKEDRLDPTYMPQNDLTAEPDKRNTNTFLVALSMLTLSFVIIGAFLVNRLRRLFKENYWQHTNSIIWSIILCSISSICIIAENLIRVERLDHIQNHEQEFLSNNSWKYPLIIFGMQLLGFFLPASA